MRDIDGVVAGGVELAVALVADAHVPDRLAPDGGVLGQREDLSLGQQLRGGAACECDSRYGGDEADQHVDLPCMSHSAMAVPEPPISLGRSFSFGSPSRMLSVVS